MSVMTQRESRLRIPLPSRSLQYLPGTAFAVDAVVIVLTTTIAMIGRDRWGLFSNATDLSGNLGLAWPAIIVTWLTTIWACGGYSHSLFDAGTDEFRRVARATFTAAALVGVGAFLLKYSLSRGFFVLAFGLGVPTLLLGRLVLRRAIYAARRHGSLLHTVLIAGSPRSIDEVAAVLRRERRLGYRVIGAVTPFGDAPHTPGGVPVLGVHTNVAAKARETGADIVFFADGGVVSADAMRRIAWDLEHDQVQVVVAPSVSDVASERVRIRPVGGLPLIHIDPPRLTDASRWGKRTFDVLGSAFFLLCFSPLLVFAAFRVKVDDGGSVLFRQTRVGRNGEHFTLLKFRTMVPNAEQLLADLHSDAGYREGLFKLKDDPRITKPGKFLRRFSIDELPQLINVFRGDMSLIGPRPPLPLEVAQYDELAQRRLRVRPGLTGLWQVSGRSDLSWDEAIRLDIYYVDNWSILQDASILLKTLGAVVGSRGAY